MIDQQQFERLVHVLPVLEHAELGLVREFRQKAFFARIPSGHDVFIEGERVDANALLVSGVVRV